MRFFIVILGLSTLAVAGPLPSLSKNALEARTQPLTLANNTLDPDSIAALSKLKATYDSLNNQAGGLNARSSDSISASANITLGPDLVAMLNELKMIYNNLNKAEQSSTSIEKRDFLSWLEDKLAEEGLWPRSSTVANYTLSPESIAALTKLRAEYDSRNEKRMEKNLAKRDFWHWLKTIFEAPGLKARSAIPNSAPANITLDADSAAALAKSKAVYDSLNKKSTDKGVIAKRGFWSWLEKMYGTPPNVQISSR